MGQFPTRLNSDRSFLLFREPSLVSVSLLLTTLFSHRRQKRQGTEEKNRLPSSKMLAFPGETFLSSVAFAAAWMCVYVVYYTIFSGIEFREYNRGG